jgi:hypothetical protein
MTVKQTIKLTVLVIGLLCGSLALLPTDDAYAQSSECYVDKPGEQNCQTRESFGDDPAYPVNGRISGNGALCSTSRDIMEGALYSTDCQEATEECLQDAATCTGEGTGKDPNACKEGDADCCAGVKTSVLKGKMCDDEDGVIFGILKEVLRILTAGVGVAAVGGIAWGALLYTTAESKPEQTKKAIGIITNVVIGLVAYAVMGVLLNFVIPGGVFGS